jgi:mycofactocin precursor
MPKEAVEAPEEPVVTPGQVPKVAELCAETASHALVEADLLVEDVSIDGMCGVY